MKNILLITIIFSLTLCHAKPVRFGGLTRNDMLETNGVPVEIFNVETNKMWTAIENVEPGTVQETDPVALPVIDEHRNNFENPHRVTAAQVGAATVADLDGVLSDAKDYSDNNLEAAKAYTDVATNDLWAAVIEEGVSSDHSHSAISNNNVSVMVTDDWAQIVVGNESSGQSGYRVVGLSDNYNGVLEIGDVFVWMGIQYITEDVIIDGIEHSHSLGFNSNGIGIKWDRVEYLEGGLISASVNLYMGDIPANTNDVIRVYGQVSYISNIDVTDTWVDVKLIEDGVLAYDIATREDVSVSLQHAKAYTDAAVDNIDVDEEDPIALPVIAGHVADMNNPHGVTAEQVRAVPRGAFEGNSLNSSYTWNDGNYLEVAWKEHPSYSHSWIRLGLNGYPFEVREDFGDQIYDFSYRRGRFDYFVATFSETGYSQFSATIDLPKRSGTLALVEDVEPVNAAATNALTVATEAQDSAQALFDIWTRFCDKVKRSLERIANNGVLTTSSLDSDGNLVLNFKIKIGDNYYSATEFDVKLDLQGLFTVEPIWYNRSGLAGDVEFVNTDNSAPQAWAGTAALNVTGFSGLASPVPVYWTLSGFTTVTFPAGVYFVGGGAWQPNMVNHFLVWQVGGNVFINFLTASAN